MIIYKITNLLNKKCYIGQTVNRFNIRYSGGRWWDTTTNIHLSNAVGKYGLINFRVEFLEENVDSIEKLNELERIYAEKFNAYHPNGYNSVGCGDNRFMLQCQKDLLSKVQKKKKVLLRRVDTWELIEVEGIRKFVRENDLNYRAFSSMINESSKTIISQGFCLPKRTKEEIDKIKKKSWIDLPIDLIRPDGTLVSYKTAKEARSSENLPRYTLPNLLRGFCEVSRGYKLQSPTMISKKNQWRAILISPLGEEVFLDGIIPFIKENKPASFPAIRQLLLGERERYKGWSLKKLISKGAYR